VIQVGSRWKGRIEWTCKPCGRKYDHSKVFPIFDFTKKQVHCGCLNGQNRA
jgi:hypothetical protein